MSSSRNPLLFLLGTDKRFSFDFFADDSLPFERLFRLFFGVAGVIASFAPLLGLFGVLFCDFVFGGFT